MLKNQVLEHKHLFVNIHSKIPCPIVSLSLNPAIDLTYQISHLTHNQKSRAIHTVYDPGGTGINVGRALKKLNVNASTCCIIAGTMGKFLQSMLEQELDQLYTLPVTGETRINTTLLQRSPLRQYEINAAGPAVNQHQFDQIISQFLSLCGQGIGILTGSLPPNIADDSYQQINQQLQQQGGRAIIDAPVAVLKKALNSQPFLIKPNLHELETLQNKSLSTLEQIAMEARLIVQQGVEYVCVSLGEKGAVLTGVENSYYCNSPVIDVHSSVGSGDAMVAGLASAFAQNKTPEHALMLAVACGAGTAKQSGTQLFKFDDIALLSQQMFVKTLDI